MDPLTGKNFIGKTHTDGKRGSSFKAIDPSVNKVIEPSFYAASPEDVENAIKLANNAFDIYKNVSGKKKADFLEAMGDQILSLGDALIERAVLETALPKGRLEGENVRTVNQLKMFAGLLREGSWVEASIDTAIPDREPVPKPDLRKMLVPIGPVVVFGASNFPLAFSTAGGDTASALAAGNPVIVKAHNSHPGTSEMVASAILQAAELTGMPDGVFSHLQDSGFEVGKRLVTHPDVRAVGFTGSFTGGKALFDLGQKREVPIPVFAEMGSINPVIILPGALEERSEQIAEMYAGSITLGAGQFCTNPGLMVAIESESLEKFSKSLDQSLSRITNTPMLNQGIYSKYESGRKAITKESGLSVISDIMLNNGEEINKPVTTIATVNAVNFIDNPKLHEEIFGPYSLLVKCSRKEDLISIARKLKGQLTITVMATGEDLDNYKLAIDILREKAGRMILNGVPTGVEVCSSMQHGGPFPATTDSRFTSVGTGAIKRFVRPLSYQNWPDRLLPPELKNRNPLGIWRIVNNNWTKEECK